MNKFFILILIILFSKSIKAQTTFVIPTTVGSKFEKSYYDKPVKLVVPNFATASEKQKLDMIDFMKDLGFTNSIVLAAMPNYPNKAYRDSIALECDKANVETVLELNFAFFEKEILLFFNDVTMAITVKYGIYDKTLQKAVNPIIYFAAGSFKRIKKMMQKNIPLN